MNKETGEYENFRRIVYDGGMVFVPVCPICGRFVKADKKVMYRELEPKIKPNAVCKKCGRINMIFEGWV